MLTFFCCRDVEYRAYKVASVDDLYNPFVSMYFGAAYLAWLSVYEGRLVCNRKSELVPLEMQIFDDR